MAKEQGKIVKSITNLEEQLAGFTQLLEVVAQEVWQELQPSLARVGSLEELVARVGGDLSSLEEQVEQAEAKVVAGRHLLVSCAKKMAEVVFLNVLWIGFAASPLLKPDSLYLAGTGLRLARLDLWLFRQQHSGEEGNLVFSHSRLIWGI